jgi:hypothetical protein
LEPTLILGHPEPGVNLAHITGHMRQIIADTGWHAVQPAEILGKTE